MNSGEIASLIRWHRRRAGLKQADLAQLAGVSRSVIGDLEGGSLKTSCTRLAAVLGALHLELEPKGPLVGAWRALGQPFDADRPERQARHADVGKESR